MSSWGGADRRAHVRVAVALRAHVGIVVAGHLEFRAARTIDVSLGGAALALDAPLREPTETPGVVCLLHQGPTTLVFIGRRVTAAGDDDRFRVMFNVLPREDAAALADILGLEGAQVPPVEQVPPADPVALALGLSRDEQEALRRRAAADGVPVQEAARAAVRAYLGLAGREP